MRRALSHNIRNSGDVKYLTGDSVYFKRLASNSWHGPAKVLGQDGQQVLVKKGSRYIRVHPCRLQFIDHKNDRSSNDISQSLQKRPTNQYPTANSQIQPTIQTNDNIDSDDDNTSLTLPSNSEPTKPTQHDHINNNNGTLIQYEQAANMNNPKIQSINKVRSNNLIKYKISNSSDWENAKILS